MTGIRELGEPGILLACLWVGFWLGVIFGASVCLYIIGRRGPYV